MNIIKLFATKHTTVLTGAVDSGAAISLIKSFIEPITTILAWSISPATVIACLGAYIMHVTRDEEERQQKPLRKTLFYLIKWGAIIQSISVILKIVGI